MNSNRTANHNSQEILDSIRRIVRALRISAKSVERDLGISSAQLYVLEKLKDEDGLSLNELAAKTLTHQSSVSVVVSKLVEQGLVQRKKAKADERRVVISITASGLTLLRKAPEPFQKRLIRAIENLEISQSTQVAEGLRSIVKMTEIESGPAPLFFEEKTRRGKQHD